MLNVIRLAVLDGRAPPSGSVDFALSPLVVRHLALVRALSVAQPGMPDDTLDAGGAVAPWVFEMGFTHAVVIGAGSRSGSDLHARAALVDSSHKVVSAIARGTFAEPDAVAKKLTRDVLGLLGVHLSASEERFFFASSIPRGPALGHMARHWHAVFDPNVAAGEAARTLDAAADAGYAAAWLRKVPLLGGAARLHARTTPDAATHLSPIARACQLDPTLVAAHAKRAELLRLAGRAREALLVADAALRWAPQVAALVAERAQTLLALWRIDEAEAEARAAIALDPTCDEALLALGRALQEKGRFEEAVELHATAASAMKGSVLRAVAHGAALNRARRFQDARRVLSDVLSELDWRPWWRMPFEEPHLDPYDATRLAIEEELAHAAAGAGDDPMPHAREVFRLARHPQLLVSPEYYVTVLRAKAHPHAA